MDSNINELRKFFGKVWKKLELKWKVTILYKDHEYNAICKISESTTGRPLFECIMNENGVVVGRSGANNPTTAVKAMQIGNISISFKNGSSFFGLDKPEVLSMQARATSISNSQSNIAHASISNNRQASWFGIINFGVPYLDIC